MSIIEIRRYIQ